jgi:hypothetical protein
MHLPYKGKILAFDSDGFVYRTDQEGEFSIIKGLKGNWMPNSVYVEGDWTVYLSEGITINQVTEWQGTWILENLRNPPGTSNG